MLAASFSEGNVGGCGCCFGNHGFRGGQGVFFFGSGVGLLNARAGCVFPSWGII